VPAVIESLNSRQGDGERVKLTFVGGVAIVVPAQIVVEHGLRAGALVDERGLERLRAEAEMSQARARGLRYLEARERSCAEVGRRLTRYGYTQQVVDGVVEWLGTLGYIDDARFAESYVRSSRRRALGPRRIRAELRLKGVATEVIEHALNAALEASSDSAEGELEELTSQVRRKFGRLMVTDPVAARRRAAGLLGRRGYQGSVIDKVIRSVEQKLQDES